MNAIQEVKDENIRKVAQTLRSSGLASSETEAIRMAMMMSKTSQKVTENFDHQRTAHQNPFQPQEVVHPEATRTTTQHTDIIISNHRSSSVQEKPRKTEEKEEFIFGEIQEKESVQKKDVYKVENEFEEVVVQEVIITKDSPHATLNEVVKETIREVSKTQPSPQAKSATFNGRPSMFGSGTMASNPTPYKPVDLSKPITQSEPASQSQVYHAPRPVPQPVAQSEYRPEPVHVSQQMPTQKPASNPSPTPVVAVNPAQMAFASLLGDIQKTQTRHQEQKPAVHSPAQASSDLSVHVEHQVEPKVETQSASQSSQVAFSMLLGSAQKNPHYEEEVKHGEQEATKVATAPVEAPKEHHVQQVAQPVRVATVHSSDPRANMMTGVDVDLTKMFNVNK